MKRQSEQNQEEKTMNENDRNEKTPEANEFHENAIKLNPNDEESILKLYESSLRIKDYTQAIKSLRILVDNFEYDEYIFKIIELAIIIDDCKLAYKYLNKRISFDPFSTANIGLEYLIEHYFSAEKGGLERLKSKIAKELIPDLSIEFMELIDRIEVGREIALK